MQRKQPPGEAGNLEGWETALPTCGLQADSAGAKSSWGLQPTVAGIPLGPATHQRNQCRLPCACLPLVPLTHHEKPGGGGEAPSGGPSPSPAEPALEGIPRP